MEGTPPRRAGLFPLFAMLITAAAVFCAFAPSLHNGFVDWDDQNFLLNTFAWRGLSLYQARWAFSTFTAAHYMPLSWLSLGLDFTLWGLDPWGFHLTALILHAVTAVLAFCVFLRLLEAARPSSGAAMPARWGALFGALVFAIHPLRVESVAWITERRDVLSGVFLLACVLAYLRAQDGRTQRGRALAVCVFLYCCSLLSKAVGVTLTGTFLVLDVYPLRRLPADPRRWFQGQFRPVLKEKLLFVIPALFMAGAVYYAQSIHRLILTGHERSLLQRLAAAVWSMVFYPWKTVLPFDLSPIYEVPHPFDPLAPQFLAAGASLSIGVALLWRARNWFPAGLSAFAVYAITILPMSGLVLGGPQMTADRYSYHACLPWALLAGAALRRALESASRPAKASAALGLALLAASGTLTWRQTHIWHDSGSLWERVLRLYPNSFRGLFQAGRAARSAGNPAEAERLFRAAIAQDSTSPDAWTRLGETLEDLGREAEAGQAFLEARRLSPKGGPLDLDLANRFPDSRNAAGGRPLLFMAPSGAFAADSPEVSAALRAMREAVRRSPADPRLRNSYGALLIDTGRPWQAVVELKAAARLSPGSALVAYNCGNAYGMLRDLDEAREQYRLALSLDPGFLPARRSLEAIEAALKEERSSP